MKTWTAQATVPAVKRTLLAGMQRHMAARAAWGPPEANGWFPHLSPTGRYVLYGFWDATLSDYTSTWKIGDATHGKLNPIGWGTDDSQFFVIGEAPPAVYSVQTATRKLTKILEGDIARANWAQARDGHYVLATALHPHVVKDGKWFRPDLADQFGCAIAGEFLATARKTDNYNIHVFRGDQSTGRVIPSDNTWTMSSEGDVAAGYYGPVHLYPAEGGYIDATITPWRMEGVGALTRKGGKLWKWSPCDYNPRLEFIVIGHEIGQQQCLVLRDFPAVAVSVVSPDKSHSGEWIVAGNSDRGQLQVRWVPVDTASEILVWEKKPIDPPPPPPPPPEEKVTYKNYSEYFTRRWHELDVPGRTDEVTRRNAVTRAEAQMLRRLSSARKAGRLMTVSPRVASLEEAYKEVQCSALVQIASELHFQDGHKDVGLSTKNSGNHWLLTDGRKVASDIITLKPLDDRGHVVVGNFVLVDCIVSVGSADSRPGWDVLGENTDTSRPWTAPPVIEGKEPEEPGGIKPGQKHVYVRDDEERNECDIIFTNGVQCNARREDAIHQIVDPEEPMQKHEFVGTFKRCGECGELPDAPIHQLNPPAPGGSVDTAAIVDAIEKASKAEIVAIDRLRTDVVKTLKDLGASLPGLGKIFGETPKAKKTGRSK